MGSFVSGRKVPPRFYNRSNLLVWQNLSKNSKVVKFGFAPYLGGFVRVLMGFRLLWDTTGLWDTRTLRVDLSATHNQLPIARLGHSTLAPTTTKGEITRISLPPSHVLCRPYSCARQSKFVSSRGRLDDERNNPT